jgi:hypothetical protein
MIAALALTILLLLELARRGLEPECPRCSAKRWIAHSTLLQCESCGWSNTAPAVPAAKPEPQLELAMS